MAEKRGQRRPRPADLAPLLELIWNGKSLRSACQKLGLHAPATSEWIHADPDRREQYARACEARAEYLQEDALTMNRAAALGIKVGANKVEAAGARGYLDAVKWATGRMAPKTIPVQRIDVTHLTREMSDEELAAEIAAREARKNAEG